MLKEICHMFTYEYAAQSKKNLAINLILTTVKSAIFDFAFIAACFLILLLI